MQDFKTAARALRATPLVSAVAILSLALGIGANTAMFSIVDTLLLRALPVREPERLALVSQDKDGSRWTNPVWEQIRDRPQLFDGAIAWSGARFNRARTGETDFAAGLWTNGDFFRVLGVQAELGRVFTAADDARGGGPDGAVAVISHAYWQSRFGSARDVIGKTISLNSVNYTIVGVSAEGFTGPDVGSSFDVAVPIGTEPLQRGRESSLDQRSSWWLSVAVRLRPGMTLESGTAAIETVRPQIREATLPPNWSPKDLEHYLNDGMKLFPAAAGASFLRGRYRKPLVTIQVVVGLVLLIACGNIANLLLARATARRHELSVRTALGASRLHLARQLLAESLLLSGLGAALGVAIATWGSRLLVSQLSTPGNVVFLDLGLDWRVLGFTALVAVVTAILFGTVPALRAARVAPIDALKEQGRGSSDRRVNLAGGLVVTQVALSLVLIVAAGLFVRTFAALANQQLGFEKDGLLVVNIGAQRAGVDSSGRAQLYDRALQAALSVPGVESAALSDITPVSGAMWNDRVKVSGGVALTEQQRISYANMVSPGWFATYRTRLVTGRDFGDGDRVGSPKVAIVNQAFARRFLNGANPIGHTITEEAPPGVTPSVREIVGVVEDAIYYSVRDSVPPTMYFATTQEASPGTSIALTVRLRGVSPATANKSLASALVAVNPNITLSFRVLSSLVRASLTRERLVAMLSGFFGALAVLLAGLGLYGVTSYSVNRRHIELGIRMALGTPPSGVVGLVMSRVGTQVGVGVLLGLLVSWWATRFVQSLLYGMDARNVPTMVAASLLLAGVGAIAGLLPARRAARIDPAVVLRDG